MAEEEQNFIMPGYCVSHDSKEYTMQLDLPGVDKKDIDLEIGENGLCVNAPRKEEIFTGCWVLAHEVKQNEAKAHFENGLLTITVPLAEMLKGGRKIMVE